eukprot:Hpha_TRINITY_DN18445_c0_g1::TRINITY_DN18445_c0_g1_i1::g.165336::m.165336/K17619/MDP1; magnesium-dependent phosphatase 1
MGHSTEDVLICGVRYSRAHLPRVVVFDVDYTLWPFWVDTHRSPPYRVAGDNVVDRSGDDCSLYRDVPRILLELRALPDAVRPKVAFASRTSAPDWLKDLAGKTLLRAEPHAPVRMWDAPDYREIYPGSKLTHFRRIAEQAGVPPHSMLFFDDEAGSNRDVLKVGVKFVEVGEGLTLDLFHKGLGWFAENIGIR